MLKNTLCIFFPGLKQYTWCTGGQCIFFQAWKNIHGGVGRRELGGCGAVFGGEGVGGFEPWGGGMERGLLNINDFFVLLWLAIIASCLNGSLTQVASKSVPGLQLSQSTRQQVHRPGTFQACYQIASNCWSQLAWKMLACMGNQFLPARGEKSLYYVSNQNIQTIIHKHKTCENI